MKVIAEFVDSRNGKRYQVGEGWKIDPPLEAEQIERLKSAGVLRDGDDPKIESAPLVVLENIEKMGDLDLIYLSRRLEVDMMRFESRAGLVEGLKHAQKQAVELQAKADAADRAGAGGDKLPDVDKMNKAELEALAAEHKVDLSACTNNGQRADKLKAAGVGA